MSLSQPAPSVEEIREIVASQLHLEGPLLPIFHALQQTFGCVPQAALPVIAEALNITRAEVHGVMSFYHDFRTLPAGKHVVKICRAEACQALGANGSRVLELNFLARSEALFLRNEGNVCSSRFHQSLFAGERGFDNCTGLAGYLAWGALAPSRGAPVRANNTGSLPG